MAVNHPFEELIRQIGDALVRERRLQTPERGVRQGPAEGAPARSEVHTVVVHTAPDLEALYMLFLIASNEALRKFLNIHNDFRVMMIPAGRLRAKDWSEQGFTMLHISPQSRVTEEPYSVMDLEKEGYLFLDCSRGGDFDQHVAPENTGLESDVASSLDLLVRANGLVKEEPFYASFVRVISKSDRDGERITNGNIFDQKSRWPNVSLDLRTLVQALNECYVARPDLVMEVFFMAMKGLERRFLDWHQGRLNNGAGREIDPEDVDLRKMNLLTVPNALRGLKNALRDEDQRNGTNLADAKLAWFEEQVAAALARRQQEWDRAVRDAKEASWQQVDYHPYGACRRICDGRTEVVGKSAGQLLLMWGHSESRVFSVATRMLGADITIHFKPERGMFMVSRKGDQVSMRNICRLLRVTDAWKRNGWIVEPVSDWDEPDSECVVEFRDGARISTSFFPGWCFGNDFPTAPGVHAPSALSSEEIVRVVEVALNGGEAQDAINAVEPADHVHRCSGGSRKQ